MYCVYCHRNKINGKRYICQTKYGDNPELRWGKDGKGYRNNHFWSSIQKYGWDNFEHIILAKDLSKEQANKLEIYYISLYNSTDRKYGYNHTNGGEGGNTYICKSEKEIVIIRSKISIANSGKIPWNKGKITPEETRKKISNANKGKEVSLETREKLSKASTGRKLSIDTKQKISNANKGNTYCLGRILSESTKQKISETRKGHKCMNNGKKCIVVRPEDIDYYKELGYVFGRLKTK